MAELSRDQKIITANPLYAEMFGRSVHDLTGQSYSVNFPPDDRNTSETRQFWDRLLNGKSTMVMNCGFLQLIRP